MDILTRWLRSFVPELPVDDAQLAEALTLRGIAVEGVFPAAGGGSRFEMDITTNRVDAMNHYGVAREAAAIFDLPLHSLEQGLAAPVPAAADGEGFPVRIEADDLCGRFTARVVRGVTVKPAAGEIAAYFADLGQKPISGPVDVTNYGWLAMGQPTHVFDLDQIEGGIVVRRARTGEKLRLLDGTERTLVTDDLVVADERKALGLAGVMGGWESRVTEETRNILVEAAWFDPAAIRASSRRHGLHTDASHRFERGADFNAAPLANHLVTRLVLEQAGGVVTGPLVDVQVEALAQKTAQRPPIALRVSEVQRVLGTTLKEQALDKELVSQYLAALGCVLVPSGEEAGAYKATLPSWRLDLEREIDLIEEVARVYGYNGFANTLPAWSGEVHDQPHKAQERAIRSTLLSLGFTEAISSTFTSAAEAQTFGAAEAGIVPLENPLNEEAGVLRPALVAGMAGMLARNLSRDRGVVRLFELGTVFTGSTLEVKEQAGLALGATGGEIASALHRPADALLFEVKGAIEQLFARFQGRLQFAALAAGVSAPAWIAPGRGGQVLWDGRVAGFFGELSAAEAAGRKLRQTVVLAELNAALLLATPLRQPALRELSRFQAVERDFSFVFPDSVGWEAIETRVRSVAPEALQAVRPLEIFRDRKGQAIAEGSYSLLTRVTFQSPERTLTDDELTAWSEGITQELIALGGRQRA